MFWSCTTGCIYCVVTVQDGLGVIDGVSVNDGVILDVGVGVGVKLGVIDGVDVTLGVIDGVTDGDNGGDGIGSYWSHAFMSSNITTGMFNSTPPKWSLNRSRNVVDVFGRSVSK